MTVDTFMQNATTGFVVGLVTGVWITLKDVFDGSLPRLRDLGRELGALQTLLVINRTGDRARQSLLEAAQRNLGESELPKSELP